MKTGVAAIARLCSNDGGPAVYQARSLYNILVDSVYWGFADTCLATTGESRISGKQEKNYVVIYPNPLPDGISLNIASTLAGTFILKSLTGTEVARQTITVGNNVLPLNRKSVPQGLYLYEMDMQNGQRNFGKLVLIK